MWYIDNTLIDLESGPGWQDLESSHQPGEWLVPPPLPPHPRPAGGRSPTPTSSASSLLWTSNLNRTFKVLICQDSLEEVQLFLYIYYILELFPAGDGQARLTPWMTSRLTIKEDSGGTVLHCSPTEELLPTRAHLTTLLRAREKILCCESLVGVLTNCGIWHCFLMSGMGQSQGTEFRLKLWYWSRETDMDLMEDGKKTLA